MANAATHNLKPALRRKFPPNCFIAAMQRRRRRMPDGAISQGQADSTDLFVYFFIIDGTQ
jgi:hypothetical protein